MSTMAIFAVIIGYVPILGLRSFSKMSSFDFDMAAPSIRAAVQGDAAVTPGGAIGPSPVRSRNHSDDKA